MREKYREKIEKMQSDRVNGKGSAASSSAVPTRGRCSGGACSRSCSTPKDSEVEQAGSPEAPITGRRQTSAMPRGATCVLDRGKSILIADEDHLGGGGGGECSYQGPEADSLERPQNSRAVSQGHGHDKKKKKQETNDAADRVATSSSTVPGNLVPTAGPGAAPAEKRISGIRPRNGKHVVEIRVAKKKLLGFDKISLGSYCTQEQAYVARLVGDYYCRKWPPPDCSNSDRLLLPPLPDLDPKLPPDEMKKEIQEVAWCAAAGTVALGTHPGRGLINAAAAAPVQQRVENEGGFSHFEPDRAQRAPAAAAGVNNPRSNFYQIGSHRLDPDTTQQDDSPNTQELQHLRQQRSSHGTAAAGDLQYSHVLRPQPPAVEPLPVDQHSGDLWDTETRLNRNEEEEGQVSRTDLMWAEINTETPQSDMELDQQENQGDKMFEQLLEQYCDEMQYQQMQF